MRILVISDLHIGVRARTQELCPYPEGLRKDDKLVSSFIDFTKDYQKQKGLFDYLIIPGDITHQSNLIEYDCGDKFLKKIIKELGIDESRVIFVPGNHDVDWSVIEGKTIQDAERIFRSKHKYNTLKDDKHIFSQLTSHELLEFPFIKKWIFDDAVFFGFNSSWHDDALKDKHYGLIELSQIEKMREELELTDFKKKMKIFVVHHHMQQYLNPLNTWFDFSCMQNAQPLLELLSEFSFDFIIHGHRHVPYFTSTTFENYNPINILCSGSYSCEVPTEISGLVGNLFHIVETDVKDKCKGRVISMAYDPTKYVWVNSRENQGIEYENAFGIEIKYDDLKKQCFSIVEDILKSSIYFEYSLLLENIPDLKYLSNNVRKKLINQIELNFKLTPGVVVDQKVIFIKRNKNE